MNGACVSFSWCALQVYFPNAEFTLLLCAQGYVSGDVVDVSSSDDVMDIYAGVVVPDAAEPSFGKNLPNNDGSGPEFFVVV